MLERLRNGPWWVLAIFAGAMFFVGQIPVVVLNAEGRSPVIGLVVALVGSAAWGLAFAVFVVRLRRRFVPLLTGADGRPTTPAQRKAMARAMIRGPLPTEADARRSVAGLIKINLDMARWLRWFVVPACVGIVALSAYLGITESPSYALAAPLVAGLLTYWFWSQRRMRHRLGLLEAAPRS